MKLQIDESAKDFLVYRGYHISFGARPLKRVIQKHIINPLATKILMGDFVPGDIILLRAPGNGKIEFSQFGKSNKYVE